LAFSILPPHRKGRPANRSNPAAIRWYTVAYKDRSAILDPEIAEQMKSTISTLPSPWTIKSSELEAHVRKRHSPAHHGPVSTYATAAERAAIDDTARRAEFHGVPVELL
jgi:hypothetical protein